MQMLNATIPTPTQASQFSMEFAFYPGVPVGVHGRHFNFGEYGSQLEQQCPEAALIAQHFRST
jgi:hypothetical protein